MTEDEARALLADVEPESLGGSYWRFAVPGYEPPLTVETSGGSVAEARENARWGLISSVDVRESGV